MAKLVPAMRMWLTPRFYHTDHHPRSRYTTPRTRMPKDPERQHRLARALQHSDTPAGLDGLLGRLFYPSSHPWELVLIHADGTRHVIDPNTPIWVLPSFILALGAALTLLSDDPLAARILFVAIFFVPFAALAYVKQAWTERLLRFDAQRRSAIVLRGRRVVVEIPFDDIDEIFVQVRADASYGDSMRAVASIGSASLPLTMWTTEDPAVATAKAVGELMGLPGEPKQRRLMPET